MLIFRRNFETTATVSNYALLAFLQQRETVKLEGVAVFFRKPGHRWAFMEDWYSTINSATP